jgi:hypothetical protein
MDAEKKLPDTLDEIMHRLSGLVPGHVMVLLVLPESSTADDVAITANTSAAETFVILLAAQTKMLDAVIPAPVRSTTPNTKMN